MRRLIPTSLSLLSVFVVIALCSSVFAQGMSYGTIEGLVTDDKGNPIAGAAVTATGPQGVKTAVTGDRGRFVFKDLVPGNYQVKAEAQNYATVLQTDVKVVVGHSTQVPFALAAGVTEQVTVTSEAPIVDMKATSVGATVSVDEFVEYVPLGRNFTAMLQLAPGVVSSGPYAENNGNFSMSGSSGLENSYLIDGVNITNSGYGGIGSFNRVYGSLSTGVTNDFIDQVEVKSGGFEAEFGQATGGVVNAIVKSGTNTLAGQVSAYTSPDSLEATRKERMRDPDAIAIESTSRQDIGFNVGGPFIKDKLFWFVAYNPVATETTWRRNVENEDVLCINNDCTDANGDGQPDNGYRDPNQTETGRMETRERENDNYAGKVSWFLHPNHRVEATAFGDPSTGKFGPQRRTSIRRTGEEGFSEIDYGGNNYSLKYSGAITSNVFVDALYAFHESELLESAAPIYSITDLTVPGGLATGGLGFSPDTSEEIDQLSLKVTWVLGNHELKVGYQQDDIEYFEAARYTGDTWTANLPVASFDNNGDPYWDGSTYFNFESTTGAFLQLTDDPASPSQLQYATQRSRHSPVEVLTTATEDNFFIQDTWSITPRWTLRLGFRWTEGEYSGGEAFTLPFEVVRRSSAAGGNRSRLVDPTSPQLFLPTSNTFDDEWAPRIGLTWDIKGDGRNKLYANYASYVQRLTQDLAYRAFSNEVDIRQSWADDNLTVGYNNGNCPVDDGTGLGLDTAPCQTITSASGLGGPSVLWPGTVLPQTQEFLIGFSHEMSPTMGIDIRYTHREIDDIIEDFAYIPQEAISNDIWGEAQDFAFDPFPDYPVDFFGEYVLANPSSNSREAAIEQATETGSTEVAALWEDGTIPDFPEPTRDYDALEFVFNKRMSDNWMMYATYRWAKLYGNYEGLFRNDNGQSDPNITSLYDFPDTPLLRGQFLNGRLNTDQEHNLGVYSTYQFPMGLNVGGGLNYTTGVPRFPLLTHPNDFYFLPGNGELPGDLPVYGTWVELDGLATNPDGDPTLADPDNIVLTTANGIGAAPSQSSDGTLDANGELVFTDYTFGSGDVVLTNNFTGSTSFLFDYTPVKRESGGRTPAVVTLDIHLSYDIKFGWRNSNLQILFDAFNIFNSQEGTFFDDVLELNQAEANPNRGRAWNYQGPRTLRLGLRWNF